MTKYRVIVTYSSEEEAYRASAPEINGCNATGPTRAEAISKLEEELAAQLENITAQGLEPPTPVEEQDFDGKLSINVSATLHRELAFMAKAESVELDELLPELLARAVKHRWSGGGHKSGGRSQSGGRGRREGQGNRYHGIMENRADFIEYVRGLETGGGGGRRGGGGRGGGRRGKR